MRHALPERCRSRLCLGLLAALLAVPPAQSWAQSAGEPVLTAAAAGESIPAADTPAANWTHHGSRRYLVRRGDDPLVLAHVDYDWRHDGKRYELRSVTETVGMLAALKPTRTVQESRGEILDEALRPVDFFTQKKRGIERTRFDWPAATLAYRQVQETLPAGTQDVLSLYVRVAWQPPIEGSLEIPVATGSKLVVYRLSASGEEQLSVGKRRYATVRAFALAGDERIDFWLEKPASGRARHFPADMPLPLRIRITDKSGTVFEQSLDPAGVAR